MIETIAPAPAEMSKVMSVAENWGCPATAIAIELGANDIL
jgi:hypothetical protein